MFDARLNQLSAQIAQMTPPQRQQFALLHKNDPILVSLTKFVNDQDQAAKTALLAKQAPQMANQPKVVDQTIAQMGAPMGAPMGGPPITQPPNAKQQGVGGLPAPNLAGMPDGGIAGPPDAQQAPPQGPGMAKGGRVRRFDEGGMASGDPLSDLYGNTNIPLPPKQPYHDPRLLGPVSSPLDQERDAAMQQVLHPAKESVPMSTQPPPESTSQRAQRMLIDSAQKAISGGGGGGGGGGPGMTAPSGRGGAGIAALPTGGAGLKLPDGYNSTDPQAAYSDTLDKLQDRGNPMQDQLDDLGEAQTDAAQSHLDNVKRRIADMGVAGADREARLNARGQRIDANYKENSATALLSAGLAMMAGTSRNPFVNIGQGAQVGLKQFTEGKSKLDEARDRLDDAFGQLEDVRRNESRMNNKDVQDAEDNIQQAVVSHMKDVYQATQQMYGVNSQAAAHIVDANIHQAAAQLGYLGNVQSADIHGRYGLAAAQVGAGATVTAARLNSQAALQGHGLMALAYGANGMHDPMRYSGVNPQLVQKYGVQAENELKGLPQAMSWEPAQRAAWVNQRTQQLVESAQGMQQSGGGGSAGAPSPAGPATYRYDPHQGLVPNQ